MDKPEKECSTPTVVPGAALPWPVLGRVGGFEVQGQTLQPHRSRVSICSYLISEGKGYPRVHARMTKSLLTYTTTSLAHDFFPILSSGSATPSVPTLGPGLGTACASCWGRKFVFFSAGSMHNYQKQPARMIQGAPWL